MSRMLNKKYGQLLKLLIEKSGYSKKALCDALEVSRPYLYSVLNGESKPPTPERQIQIAELLHLSKRDRLKLFDLAAEARKETAADIICYFRDQKNLDDFRKGTVYYYHGSY